MRSLVALLAIFRITFLDPYFSIVSLGAKMRYTGDGQRCDDVWKHLCYCQTGNIDIRWIVSLGIERVWDIFSVFTRRDRENISVSSISMRSIR